MFLKGVSPTRFKDSVLEKLKSLCGITNKFLGDCLKFKHCFNSFRGVPEQYVGR